MAVLKWYGLPSTSRSLEQYIVKCKQAAAMLPRLLFIRLPTPLTSSKAIEIKYAALIDTIGASLGGIVGTVASYASTRLLKMTRKRRQGENASSRELRPAMTLVREASSCVDRIIEVVAFMGEAAATDIGVDP